MHFYKIRGVYSWFQLLYLYCLILSQHLPSQHQRIRNPRIPLPIVQRVQNVHGKYYLYSYFYLVSTCQAAGDVICLVLLFKKTYYSLFMITLSCSSYYSWTIAVLPVQQPKDNIICLFQCQLTALLCASGSMQSR